MDYAFSSQPRFFTDTRSPFLRPSLVRDGENDSAAKIGRCVSEDTCLSRAARTLDLLRSVAQKMEREHDPEGYRIISIVLEMLSEDLLFLHRHYRVVKRSAKRE